jgi:hypothetical protein
MPSNEGIVTESSDGNYSKAKKNKKKTLASKTSQNIVAIDKQINACALREIYRVCH